MYAKRFSRWYTIRLDTTHPKKKLDEEPENELIIRIENLI